ncbi:MAG: alpha/beta hydrolase [Alphaproteobacteria bacterium]|nr:alpha/beta hydrolase [Alphaproteobacteria bacterium]
MIFFKQNNVDKKIRILWLHGWGLSHEAFSKLEPSFSDFENVLFDFPGFGKSDSPDKIWGTEDYADFINEYLKKEKEKDTYIIGQSFGCRVALRFSNKFPEKVKGLILISAAGLKRKRSLFFKVKAFCLKCIGRFLKYVDLVFKTKLKSAYSNRFGSSDYKNAKGIMKNIFVKTISEDLSNIASNIDTNTILIYGEKDEQTPPEFGKRYNNLMKNSKYIELPQFNHYNILSLGRHQLKNIIFNFITKG